ncbi:hypothetical protein PsYK624_083720 [Phanerochaete sordida]|uniref:Uncharacterized protein n=1 Tax=Phanerochaete sordida TaxID=48140 RepID=A0A9P3GD94_9APHY|nr:hypothetical protein PsYK624_083720 [Phanerochaete sordida]
MPSPQPSANATQPRGRASAGPSAARWTKDPNFSRPDGALGVDPSEMVGKVLKSIRRSPAHPTLTLHFADRTAYQVRTDGYNPAHPGVPKQLESNMDLETLLASERALEDLNWTVSRARIFKMSDKGFSQLDKRETSWHLDHTALAFQCEE